MNYLRSTIGIYFSRQFLAWSGLVLVSVSMIISIFEGIEIIRRIMTRPNVRLGIVAEILILKVPSQIQNFLPFIIFFAGIAYFWRLNQTNEFIVVRSLGISLWQIIAQTSAIVFMIGIVNLVLLDPVRAAMSARLLYIEENIFQNKVNKITVSSGGIWFKDVKDDRNAIVHAKVFNHEQELFKQITFFIFDNDGRYTKRIDCEKATIKDESWQLEKCVEYDNCSHLKNFQLQSMPTDLSIDKIKESNAIPETMNLFQLVNFIKIIEESGLSSIRYKMYLHKQLAKILMMISMIFFAAVFTLKNIRYRNIGFMISVAIAGGFGINFLQNFIFAMGMGEKIHFLIAAWFPSIFTLILSSFLLLHAEDL
jgi:lipopolysaccharide export system permease protein